MAEHRRDRVAHLLQTELATLLLREAADPRLRAVTVTGVRVTADLKQARVFVRALSVEADPKVTLAALQRATPFLRRALGRGLELRSVPELHFEYDTLPDEARRVDRLLDDARPPDAAPATDAAPAADDDEDA